MSPTSGESSVLGVRIHPVTKGDLINRIHDAVEGNRRTRVYYVNVQTMNIAASDPAFRKVLNAAEIAFCDGYGVKLGASALGVDLPERLTHMDWVDPLFKRMSSAGHSLYLVGSEQEVVDGCVSMLHENHPNLRIVGAHHGFFEKVGSESDQVVDAINQADPDVVMVGFGMPLQEFWIDRNLDSFKAPVLMPVGGLFRWYSGFERRAPLWMSDHGMEWLYRLARHPVSLFRRYALGNPLFLGRVVAARFGRDSQDA